MCISVQYLYQSAVINGIEWRKNSKRAKGERDAREEKTHFQEALGVPGLLRN
jgi:hypothetical protein